ncbi:uncharacterized protein LOC135400073 [Ornithodoros turicata]|uniref:uncharacterized protein LOC135400073 n=1 Tax=Ornithodoros turicata TaxID=34597 RepID=UPI00313A22D9
MSGLLFSLSCLLTWALSSGAAVYGRLQRNALVAPAPQEPRYYAEPVLNAAAARRPPYYMVAPMAQLPQLDDDAYEYDAMASQRVPSANYEWYDPQFLPFGAPAATQQEADDAEDAEQLWNDLMATYVSKKSTPFREQQQSQVSPTAATAEVTSTAATSGAERTTSGQSKLQVALAENERKDDAVQKKAFSGQKEFAMLRPGSSGAATFQKQRQTGMFPKQISSIRRLGRFLEDNLTEELDQLRAH